MVTPKVLGTKYSSHQEKKKIEKRERNYIAIVNLVL
jgi:hypothetical protein